MYVYIGLHFYVFISVFVSVNKATIISNNSMYYVNGDRNIIKKIEIYIGHLKNFLINKWKFK